MPAASKGAAVITSLVDGEHNGTITAVSASASVLATVYTNSLPQAFVTCVCECAGNDEDIDPHSGKVATGSSSVFVGGQPAARIDDMTECEGAPPGQIKTGSGDVFIGG